MRALVDDQQTCKSAEGNDAADPPAADASQAALLPSNDAPTSGLHAAEPNIAACDQPFRGQRSARPARQNISKASAHAGGDAASSEQPTPGAEHAQSSAVDALGAQQQKAASPSQHAEAEMTQPAAMDASLPCSEPCRDSDRRTLPDVEMITPHGDPGTSPPSSQHPLPAPLQEDTLTSEDDRIPISALSRQLELGIAPRNAAGHISHTKITAHQALAAPASGLMARADKSGTVDHSKAEYGSVAEDSLPSAIHPQRTTSPEADEPFMKDPSPAKGQHPQLDFTVKTRITSLRSAQNQQSAPTGSMTHPRLMGRHREGLPLANLQPSQLGLERGPSQRAFS